MRAVIAIAALGVHVARADVPALSTERTELLEGRIAVALVEGAEVDGADGAHTDWDDTRLTVVARDLGGVRLGDLHERIAREVRSDGQIVARIEPIRLARPNLAYGTTVRAPRSIDGRELVYAAFVVDRGGRFYELAFFVDVDDTSISWSDVSARIAATMVIPTVPTQPRPVPQGSCAVERGVDISPYPVDTVEVFPAFAGTLYGRSTTWSVWRDSGGYHAEALAGDAHVVCTSASRAALERSRRAISY
jgi:hypothetical protein